MSKVKRPQIVQSQRRDAGDEPPPAPAAAMTYWEYLRRQAATYAFGTLLCAAAMIGLAAWMGGSLGSFGRRMDAGVDVMMRAAGLTVERVVVMGLDTDVEARVREAAGVDYGASMMRADPAAIRRRIEALDPVGSASVHRLWPDQLTIIGAPRTPLALWREGDAWRVIDQRGRVFTERSHREFLDLPRVSGAGAAEAAPALLARISAHEALAARIRSAERISGRRWDVRFHPGVVVALPDDVRMAEALEAVAREHAGHGLLDQPLERINAMHPERLALRPIAVDPGAAAEGG